MSVLIVMKEASIDRIYNTLKTHCPTEGRDQCDPITPEELLWAIAATIHDEVLLRMKEVKED